jgi:hypothetical protein
MCLPDARSKPDPFLILLSYLQLMFIGQRGVYRPCDSLGENHNPSALREPLALTADGASILARQPAQFSYGAAWMELDLYIQRNISRAKSLL